jgi:hypothetical protein
MKSGVCPPAKWSGHALWPAIDDIEVMSVSTAAIISLFTNAPELQMIQFTGMIHFSMQMAKTCLLH